MNSANKAQEMNHVAYQSKANECALFENTRSPDKSELTARIDIQCPQCGKTSGFWVDAWHRTSQAGQAFIRVALKPRAEPTAHQTFRRDEQ